jgi:hypothetical protein
MNIEPLFSYICLKGIGQVNHLKRVIVMTWKKISMSCLIVIFIWGIVLVNVLDFGNAIQTGTNVYNPVKTCFEPGKPATGSIEEIYQDVFMTLLLPCINKAVDNYYEENTGYTPIVDPWQPDVLSIERPNGYRTILFIIKLEVMPYLGAHNSIGLDHITIRVSSGEVRVEKFEHIKSYPIPPWLK